MFRPLPDRPFVIFDGKCSFCRAWIDYWRHLTGDRVIYAPYQEVGNRFPDIRQQDCAAAVQLVLPDGKMCSGAHAVFRLLTLVPGKDSWLWAYERVPGVAAVADGAYQLFARERSLAYQVTKWLAGVVFSALQLAGAGWRWVRVTLFILYLSIVTAGQQFMGYQWDALLLEAGFLAIFLGLSPLIIKLFRWLLFRLMFLSGAVKLLSHDPSWHSFTSLPVHYETQPLPTPVAWYFYQLPAWFQRVSVGCVFFVELFIPFLILAPRRIRMSAGLPIISLQALIALTGNYAFFNLLTVMLCLFLLDDSFFRRLSLNMAKPIVHEQVASPTRPFVRVLCRVVYAGVLFVSGFEMVGTFSGVHWGPADKVISAIAPFDVVNTYGLFAVMTTTRPEIVVEGSDDGITWLPYEFKYKPGDLARRPPWVAPHQPRLDWQMWFAALGDYRSDPWILHFMERLLEGSPEVLGLLRSNPFPTAPPHYLRAVVYQYRFTDPAERKKTGHWWRREVKGEYVPAIGLTPSKIGNRPESQARPNSIG